MKYSIHIKRQIICLIPALLMSITACKKQESYDITGDKVNRVYVIGDNNTVKSANSFTFSVVNTPVGTKGQVSAGLPVRATMPTQSDLKVSLAIDNSMVDSYNTANGTSYKAVATNLVTLSSNATIKQGQLVSSDSIKVSVAPDKLAQLTEKAYLIPLKLAAISGDANSQISVNQNTIFIIVNISVSQLYDKPVATDMTGNLITNRTKWTATIDKPIAGAMRNLFDGNDQNYFYINSANSTLTVDLGETISGISGMRLKSYFDLYGITTAGVSSSTDGSIWTDYGTANFATGIGAQYVKFYKNVDARYIRFSITGWQNSLIALTEFDLYRQ